LYGLNESKLARHGVEISRPKFLDVSNWDTGIGDKSGLLLGFTLKLKSGRVIYS